MFTSSRSVSLGASAIGVTSRLRALGICLLVVTCITAMHNVTQASAGDRVEPWKPPAFTGQPAIPPCGSNGQCHNWTLCKCCHQNDVSGIKCDDEPCEHKLLQNPYVGTPTMANAGYGPVKYGPPQLAWCVYEMAYCTGDPDNPCARHDDFEEAISCADYTDPGLPWTCP